MVNNVREHGVKTTTQITNDKYKKVTGKASDKSRKGGELSVCVKILENK